MAYTIERDTRTFAGAEHGQMCSHREKRCDVFRVASFRFALMNDHGTFSVRDRYGAVATSRAVHVKMLTRTRTPSS